MTITRWCESGKLPAIAKPYGKRLTYKISPQALEMLVSIENHKAEEKKAPQASRKTHAELLPEWKEAMAKGLMGGRAFSPRTIATYYFYAEGFMDNYRA